MPAIQLCLSSSSSLAEMVSILKVRNLFIGVSDCSQFIYSFGLAIQISFYFKIDSTLTNESVGKYDNSEIMTGLRIWNRLNLVPIVFLGI